MLSWTVNEIWTRRQSILESGSVTFGTVFARPALQWWVNCSQVREETFLCTSPMWVCTSVSSEARASNAWPLDSTALHVGQECGVISVLSGPIFPERMHSE